MDRLGQDDNSNMSGVQKATSMITLPNIVKKRFNCTQDEVPQVKIITVNNENSEQVTLPFINSSSQTNKKPARRPRKADLSKVVKEPEGIKASTTPSQQVVYLGDTTGIDLSQASSSLQRWAEETRREEEVHNEDTGVVYYVQCPECNKKLKQKSYRSHVRTHLGVKQFRCDLCDDRFTRRNDVLRHKRLIHEKPRDFQCKQCHKYFVTLENLQSHRESHNTELRCRVCGHGFGKWEYYENHVRLVHPDGGRPSPPAEKTTKPTEEVEEHPPSILRRGEKRKACLDNRNNKLIYLGENCSQNEFKGVKKDKLEKENPPGNKIKDILPKNVSSNTANPIAAQSEDGLQIVSSSAGNMGKLLKVSDGTFVIVDCDVEEQTDSQTDNSQDAVQTLIDAVQELIQTHEAGEREDPDEEEDPLSEKMSDESNRPENVSEEVWRNLHNQFPGAEFVVVTNP